MSKKNFANCPSQSAQEYVTTQDGRTVKNIAYLPTSQQLSELTDPTLPNKTLASEPESVYEYKHHSWRKVWLNDNDEYHRNGDKPAVFYENGTQMWYQNGKKHRDNGPAVIKNDGTQKWYQNDKKHRENGPAVIKKNGHSEWWVNGELHRDNGPAIIHSDGQQAWYNHGRLHRENGPAIIYGDGQENGTRMANFTVWTAQLL